MDFKILSNTLTFEGKNIKGTLEDYEWGHKQEITVTVKRDELMKQFVFGTQEEKDEAMTEMVEIICNNHEGGEAECPKCGNTGTIETVNHFNMSATTPFEDHQCDECNGSGVVIIDEIDLF